MDSNRNSKRKRTGSSTEENSADETAISSQLVETESNPVGSELAANSSVGQSEVDGLLGRFSQDFQRFNADLRRKDEEFRAAKVADSLEILRLKEELSAEKEKLVKTERKLTQSEKAKSYAFGRVRYQLGQKRQQLKQQKVTSKAHKRELKRKTAKIDQLRAERQSLKDELQQKDDPIEEKLLRAESLTTEFAQLYTGEKANRKSAEEQVEFVKAKNRQKDELLAEQRKELTEKSAEIHKKSGEILKLRQSESRQNDQQLAELQNEVMAKSAEIHSKSGEIVKLRQNAESLWDELQEKDDEIEEAERSANWNCNWLKTQWKTETAKLKSVEKQLECEKGKNRPKDQKLAEQQNELIVKSTEILKLRQTAQSLRVDLASKSDEILSIKSEIKTALYDHLDCSFCSPQVTESVVTGCGQIFCQKCIEYEWNQGHRKCSFCHRSECHRSAPVVAIQQLQAKLLSWVNGEQPIVTQRNGENLPSGSNSHPQ